MTTRLARAILLLGALALLFAPGVPKEAIDHAPGVLTASVLAPTVDDAGSTPATARHEDLFRLGVALLAAAVLVTGAGARATAPLAEPASSPAARRHRRPHRRGPPLLPR